MNGEDTVDERPRDPLIEAIRERAMAYIKSEPGHEGISLRELSRRIGMSASGLMKFAMGGMPYTPTRRKLIRWYKTLTPATREEQKRDGLALLLADVHPRDRPEAERRILETVAAYESAPADAPPADAPRQAARRASTAAD
jgi:transcriptional regulator with XRE-family HTH domain